MGGFFFGGRLVFGGFGLGLEGGVSCVAERGGERAGLGTREGGGREGEREAYLVGGVAGHGTDC